MSSLLRDVMSSTARTSYEEIQDFSFLTRWLHGYRYRYIKSVLARESRRRTKRLELLEIGCAHGKLFEQLDDVCPINYTGVDLNENFVHVARQRYAERANFRAVAGDVTDPVTLSDIPHPDVVVALETLEHIPEFEVIRVLEQVRKLNPPLFVCSVPVEVGPAVWLKNVGSFLTGYVRHQEYSWAETFWAGLYALDQLPPHTTGHKGFDWRWLVHAIRTSFVLEEVVRFPSDLLPAAVSTSIFIVARPRPAANDADR